MAIPAIRFKPFNEEMNVAIATFEDIQTNDIFNSPNAALKEVSDGLKDLLDKNKPDLGKLESLKDDLTRATSDIFSTVKDVTGMIPKDIEKTISGMLPDNPVVQNMFKQLSMECKTGALGNRHNTRGYKDRNSCNSGNGKCDKSQINGMLGKLTGGASNSLAESASLLNNALNSLIGLSNLGYDVGLCKIFQSLAGNLPNNVVGRAGAVLMGQLAGKGNTSGIIDVAGQMSGLSPLLEFPGAISKAVSSFSTKGLGLAGASALMNFGDRFSGSMEILKDNWLKSDDGGPSIAELGDDFNPIWGGYLDIVSDENDGVDLDDLDSLSDNDSAAVAAAYNSVEDFAPITQMADAEASELFAGLGSEMGDLEPIDAAEAENMFPV